MDNFFWKEVKQKRKDEKNKGERNCLNFHHFDSRDKKKNKEFYLSMEKK